MLCVLVARVRAVVEDVLAAVTHVHVSGRMHETVLADIGRQETEITFQDTEYSTDSSSEVQVTGGGGVFSLVW